MATSFKVSEIKCTDLLNVEFIGKIDPYVTIEYLGVKKKTETKDNELNPVYGEVLDFDLSGKALGPEDFLKITVKDYETFQRNRIVGKAEVYLQELLKTNTVTFQSRLLDKNDRPTTVLLCDNFWQFDEAQGIITFKVEYIVPEGGATGGGGDDRQVREEQLADEDEDPNTMLDGTPIPWGPERGAMRAEKRKKQAKKKSRREHNLPDKPTNFQVRIKVIEGRQLPGGNINPTVRVIVGPQIKQTRVKHSTNKPYFDETFFFNFNERPNELFDELVIFEVYNAKSILSDALLGTFQFDVGTIYFEDSRHAIFRKWLLMTTPEDNEDKEETGEAKGVSAKPGGPPAGYVKITAFVLGPGDELPKKYKGSGEDDGDEDIESNLLQPAGVRLRPATFLVKIYHAEDMPQMDTAAFNFGKKLFSSKPPKDRVDPYVKLSFAGKTQKTNIKYNSNRPSFNEELRIAFKFPSMCERLKLQLIDWDRIGNHDCIGTSFISLSAISGNDSEGFLPCFGPCYVNFYGSTREYSDFSDEYDDLNKGRGEGCGYRGRALVEISTRFGDYAKKPVQNILAQELVRVQTYKRRRTYKLFASFMSANMLSKSDRLVEFEVSIGNYGNKLDPHTAPQSSSTPPTNPVYDGNSYYFLPWQETKPCCEVESHWEDIAFRLEPINCLLKIIMKLEINIEKVELGLKARKPKSPSKKLERYSDEDQLVGDLLELLNQFIADVSMDLPKFQGTDNGVNELDLKKQETRSDELLCLKGEARNLKEEILQTFNKGSATNFREALDTIGRYLKRMKDLCLEPQNSMPDVVIWMIAGSKRIAYYRIHAYELLYSENPDARGRMCAKLQNFIMKYPGKKGKDVDGHPEVPASVSVILWLGLEDYSSAWTRQMEGEYSVYAEYYENQRRSLTSDWTSNTFTRPSFSDSEGNTLLNRDAFVPPDGWQWADGEKGHWFIDPEMSSNFDADAGLKKFVQDAFENESRVPGGNWGKSTPHYTNVQGDEIEHRDETTLPQGWQWADDWQIDYNRACDGKGWEYCVEATAGGWGSVFKSYHFCRRRRWIRTRDLKQDAQELMKKRMEKFKEEGGWEYAPTFGIKYHLKKRKFDFVRRRRWHCKMVKVSPDASPMPTFRIKDGKKGKCYEIMPRMFLAYDHPHKWQMRAYIFQARDILGLDSEGVSDAYAKVCFQNRSQNTVVIKETLCPDFDQTLLFEDMQLYGSLEVLKENPPFVSVELFDKDKVGKDEFLGRVFAKPLVRLNGPERPAPMLRWYDIKRGERTCGELLAVFELFLDEGADLPLTPRWLEKEKKFPVPDGIRPILVKTGVEILNWGVRNMKRYQLAGCTSPSVTFEIGKEIITSSVIKNTKKNPNFDTNNIFYREVLLPKEQLYMSPIIIKVRDHRTFGRKPVVGRHVITAITFEDAPNIDPRGEIQEAIIPDPQRGPLQTAIDPVDDSEERKKDVALDIEGKEKTRDIEEKDNWWSRYFASKKKDDIEIKKYGSFLEKGPITIQDITEDDDLDWWAKYFGSKNKDDDEFKKCGSFLEKGHKAIQLHDCELEDLEHYKGFEDFVQSFPLERGKEDDDEDDNVVGEYKGLYHLPQNTKDQSKARYFTSKVEEKRKPVDCLVRVYIIRGIDLKPKDPNGKADPYVIVELGKQKRSNKDKYIPNSINPYFGAFFQLKAKIPFEKDLKIRIMDYDMWTRHDLIGETVIDLENRYLSNCHATCGLPPTYYTSGPYQWRDALSPKQILNKVSRTKPLWLGTNQVVACGEIHKLEDFEQTPPTDPHIGKEEDQRLALYILNEKDVSGHKLVKEHVERRTLRNPLQPLMDQGQLEMFVDIFPDPDKKPPGPPVNVATRQAKDYFLRVIIWNTTEVPPSEKSITGEEMNDLYLKGWMDLQHDNKHKTDVHYRSLDGVGMFNWRWILPFKYIPAERMMIVEKKEHFWSLDKTRYTIPPKFHVQVWDNDIFTPNDFIGNLELDLSKLPRPKKEAKKVNLTMIDAHGEELMDLFKAKIVKGWWPMKAVTKYGTVIKGKVEMTLEIVTASEHELRPAGEAFDEPNMNPKLDPPKRPKTSFLWLTSPWKTLKYIVWRNYKWYIISFLIFVMLALFIVLIVYNIPKSIVRKVFGEQ